MREIVTKGDLILIPLTPSELGEYLTDFTKCRCLLDGKVSLQGNYLCFKTDAIPTMAIDAFVKPSGGRLHFSKLSVVIALILNFLVWLLIGLGYQLAWLHIFSFVAIGLIVGIASILAVRRLAKAEGHKRELLATLLLSKSLCLLYMVMSKNASDAFRQSERRCEYVLVGLEQTKQMYRDLLAGKNSNHITFPDGELVGSD